MRVALKTEYCLHTMAWLSLDQPLDIRFTDDVRYRFRPGTAELARRVSR